MFLLKRKGCSCKTVKLFFYIFTREWVGAKLLPVVPAFFCAFGMSVAGWFLGIKDENAEQPVRDEKQLRDIGGIQERAVHQRADQKTLILRAAVLVIALILIVLGVLNGGIGDVLAKGATICSECIGLG